MKTALKLIISSCLGVVLLGIFLGWRGSQLVERSRGEQIGAQIKDDLGLGQELFQAKLAQFEAQVFGVVSAEYIQHSGRTPITNADINESIFDAVGLLEIKGTDLSPLWWSVSNKSTALSAELLQTLIPEWTSIFKTMGRKYFYRALDSRGEPVMIYLSRIQIPGSQTPALAVAALPPSALNLTSKTDTASFLWDQKGYLWGYQNSSYIGSSLKNDALVQASVNEESGTLNFESNQQDRRGAFARLADTNLYLGVVLPVPGVADVLVNWWTSLILGVLGAAAISAGLYYRVAADSPEASPSVRPEQPAPPKRISLEEEVLPEKTAAPAALSAESIKPKAEEVPASPSPQSGAAIDGVINRALASYRSRIVGDDVEVVTDLDSSVRLSVKPAQLQTAIEEIIKNALDAMATLDRKILTLRCRPEGDGAAIQIQDTGLGIPEANREKIFEPFFTTKSDKARGLGLTVVKRLLEMVGGVARVEGAEGGGSLITLHIPRAGVGNEKPIDSKRKVTDAVHAARSAFMDFLDDEISSGIKPPIPTPPDRSQAFKDAMDLLGDDDDGDFKRVEIRKPKVRGQIEH